MTTCRQDAFVTIGGVDISIESADWTFCKTKKSDSFRVRTALFAADLDPAFLSLIDTSTGAITLTVAGTVVFAGIVDHVDIDWKEGKAEFCGRDRGGRMMDKVISEKFLNRTPAEIVGIIAARHALSTDVDATPARAGQTFHDTFDATAHRETEWNFLCRLADSIGMHLYVTGGTLYLKQIGETLPSLDIDYVAPTAQSFADGSFLDLRTSRNVILSQNICTRVRAHDHRSGQANSAVTTTAGVGGTLLYDHTAPPGTRADQLQTLSTKRHAETARHEFSVTLGLPGDTSLTARQNLTLSGTGTAWDRVYDIDSVRHSINIGGGYRMEIDGKAGRALAPGAATTTVQPITQQTTGKV